VVVNVSTVERNISIAIIAFDGSIVAENPSQSIPPLNAARLEVSRSGITFCRITVDGPRQSVRGGMCIVDFGLDGCITAPIPTQ
jgi:hypothetical protein